jgi:hypothetical protein
MLASSDRNRPAAASLASSARTCVFNPGQGIGRTGHDLPGVHGGLDPGREYLQRQGLADDPLPDIQVSGEVALCPAVVLHHRLEQTSLFDGTITDPGTVRHRRSAPRYRGLNVAGLRIVVSRRFDRVGSVRVVK